MIAELLVTAAILVLTLYALTHPWEKTPRTPDRYSVAAIQARLASETRVAARAHADRVEVSSGWR
ncbi:hypothetical protein D7D52_01105 [Nocardia yunnanensis]|uniref:Uncharacterized protein n=1 Tax=Nocardia yunnanensis TaxID=2382165 RepID=A0A386Z655_9NOCA|nr:hypothetical protein [Nocardia yunnanensis]AYF72713.1 hypothetical protein D7D52_01105 [Nocardia yunnanensis]